MSRAMHEDLPRPDKRVERRLAFGVFAPPVAWFVHEIVGVSITGRNCDAGLDGWQWAVLIGVSVAAAAVAVVAGLFSYRIFRGWTHGGSPTEAEGWDRVEFVSLFGMFISGLLLLNIIYFGAMPFVVESCLRST